MTETRLSLLTYLKKNLYVNYSNYILLISKIQEKKNTFFVSVLAELQENIKNK
jgi:hypothetical protein